MAAVQTAILGGLPHRCTVTPFSRTRRWPRDSMPCSQLSRRCRAEPPEIGLKITGCISGPSTTSTRPGPSATSRLCCSALA